MKVKELIGLLHGLEDFDLKDCAITTEILDALEAKPVVHGHWIVDEDGNIKCSECGHRGVGDNYCERCGVRMDEVEDATD